MIHFYSKKTLVLLAILLTNIGLRAANYDFKDNGVYYKINGTTVSVTAGETKYSGTVTIPATITNSGTTYTVTSIASNCFYECTNLEEVKLGANVTSIGYRAFYGCYNLTSINLNDKIKTLSEQAFSGCTSLKSVTLGANLGAQRSEPWISMKDAKSLHKVHSMDATNCNPSLSPTPS